MQYADYDFYANIYLGDRITPEDFPRLSAWASEYICGLTRCRYRRSSAAPYSLPYALWRRSFRMSSGWCPAASRQRRLFQAKQWAGFKIVLETLAGFILGLDIPLMAQAASNIVKGFFDEIFNQASLMG